jgi:hypothetical protein
MYNKKLLLTALKNLDKAKKPAKKKDIDYNSKMGYRKDSPFREKASMDIYTENGTIDMSETDRDILANGRVLPAYSGMHQFNTNVVNETPLEEARYGRSGNLNATNRLLVKNPLLKKNKLFKDNPLYKKKSYKRKIYDPSAMYFQDGGSSDNDSSKSIVAKPSWYQEPIVNPAAYVSGFRGGNPNMYKYGFLTTDRGNIVGGGGLGFPKSGIELTGLGVVPTSSDERQYFKGFYDAKISKDINKNINLGLGAGAAITGYPGDNGFVMDPIQLQPNVSLKYKFEDGGSILTELTQEEIQAYRDGGYIVEEITDPSIPSLNKFVKGGGKKKKGKKTITKPGEWAGVNPELVQPGNEGFDLPTTPTVPAEFETIKCPIFHKYDPSVGDCVPFTEEEKAAYSLDYMKGWVGSPMHEEMLKASIEKDAPAGDTDKYVKNITDLRLRATDPKISIKEANPDSIGEAAPYSFDESIYFDDPSKLKIIDPFTSKETTNKDLEGTVNYYTKDVPGEHAYVYPHEISHLQDMGGKLMPSSDIKMMDDYAFTPEHEAVYQNMSKDRMAVYDKYPNSTPELDKELSEVFKKHYPNYDKRYNQDKELYEKDFNKFKIQKKLTGDLDNTIPYDEFVKKNLNDFGDPSNRYGYLSDPTETRARLNALRMYGKTSGIYDPFKEKLSPEKYKELQNLFFQQNPNAADSNQLRQLREIYTDEQIFNLLNTISKKEPEQVDDFQPQQVQYGGALSKFIGGGSPCDDGYTYDPKLGCIPMSEESMTEAQQWMTNWYKNRTIEFPEDQKGFKKANEKVLPAYNPESPMFKQMESFPVYEPIPEEYMEEDPGGYPPAGMYDGEGKVPTIYFSPDLNDEQKTDTEIHELTNHFMRRSKELYPMYDKIVKENIIPFDKTWPKEKQEFYDYIINPEEQNIQSYLNVARKKFNLKPDEVVTPERLNKMREEAKKKGLLEEGGKNFNPDIFLLFRTAKDDESLMRLFNLIAKNDSNKDEIQYGQYGGTLELGDEIELTKEQVAELKKYGYTLEQI